MDVYAQKKQKSQTALGISLCALMLAGFVLTGGLWVFSGKLLQQRTQHAEVRPPVLTQPQQPQAESRPQKPMPPEETPFVTEEDADFAITQAPQGGSLSVEEITGRVKPSVTGISCYDSMQRLFSQGSGVIFRADGYIVTNFHVVQNAVTIRVTLDNGRGCEAVLVGKDAASDLAVVKIEAEGLTAAEFGDSDEVAVGSLAVVIGNANGFQNSVTQGVFSGLNRQISLDMEDGNTYTYTLLQTDAAINPGNSGGAVANKYGQVVGVSSSKVAAVDFEGLGFAIPSQLIKPVIEDLMAYGEVGSRARLGVVVTPAEELPQGAFAPENGVLVQQVSRDSDLFEKGVSKGDVIVSVEGRAIAAPADLTSMIARRRAGDRIKMVVYFSGQDELRELDVLLRSNEDIEK